MTHTVSIDVAAPVHLYDTFHAALVDHTGGRIDGLLAHVAWPTESGFRMIEIWTSNEAATAPTRRSSRRSGRRSRPAKRHRSATYPNSGCRSWTHAASSSRPPS